MPQWHLHPWSHIRSDPFALSLTPEVEEPKMQLTDSRDIQADRATVWAALLSPEVLQACVPGCKEMSGTPEEGFEATVVQKVGPVKATFKGAVSFADMVEGQALTLTGDGKGGAAGFAKGGAKDQSGAADASCGAQPSQAMTVMFLKGMTTSSGEKQRDTVCLYLFIFNIDAA